MCWARNCRWLHLKTRERQREAEEGVVPKSASQTRNTPCLQQHTAQSRVNKTWLQRHYQISLCRGERDRGKGGREREDWRERKSTIHEKKQPPRKIKITGEGPRHVTHLLGFENRGAKKIGLFRGGGWRGMRVEKSLGLCKSANAQ